MKTLSTTSEQERLKRGQDVVWLLEIDWPDQTRRYATRAMTVGPNDYEGAIDSVDDMTLSAPSFHPFAGPPTDRATVTLRNRREDSGRLESLCLRHDPEGLECRLGMVFVPPSGSVASDDAIVFQRFEIDRVLFESGTAELWLESSLLRRGGRRATRVVTAAMAPGLSDEAIGRTLPLCFGEIARSPLVPLRVGARTVLSEAMRPDDTVATVSSLSGFPSSGWFQIGAEEIRYLATDASAMTLGSSTSPLVRSAPATHPRGSAVALTPDDGFQYAVADHACLDVVPVWAGEEEVSSSTYQVTEENMDGQAVTEVVFARLPVRAQASPALGSLALDGAGFEGDWRAGVSNTASAPLSATDTDDDATFATVAGPDGRLSLEFRKDLTDGGSRYGLFRAARVKARVSASERWAAPTDVSLSIERGASSSSTLLTRPSSGPSVGRLPAHGHGDTIRDLIDDSRDLFVGGELTKIAEFDTVSGEVDLGSGQWRWRDPERALDMLSDTYSPSVEGGALGTSAPLTLSRKRPIEDDDNVSLVGVTFCARVLSDTVSFQSVQLSFYVGGSLIESETTSLIGTTMTELRFDLDSDGIDLADLTASDTSYRVAALGLYPINVYETWLEVRYKPDFAGRETALGQSREGAVLDAGELSVALPVGATLRSWDVTDFVSAQGGWAFLAQSGSSWPTLEVAMSSVDDSTDVFVSGLWLEVDYEASVEQIADDELSATVRGWGMPGYLKENPADLIETLLTEERFFDLASADVDDRSFDAMATSLSSRGYRFARRVAGTETLNDLLFSLARESGCRLIEEGGVWKLSSPASDFVGAQGVFNLDEEVALNASLPRERSPADDVVNALTLQCERDYASDDSSRFLTAFSAEEAASQLMAWGRRERRWRLFWHQHGLTDGLVDLADYALARLAYKRSLIHVEAPLVAANLERGDVVSVDLPSAFSTEAAGEVASLRALAPHRFEIVVWSTPSLVELWRIDAATRLLLRAGQSHVYVFVEGERVASVDLVGVVRLRGIVSEETLSAESMAAPIAYDAGTSRVLFGVGSGGSYESVFAFDTSGNLTIRGVVSEGVDLSSEVAPGDARYASSTSRFAVAPNGNNVVLSYDSSAGRLQLSGEIIESAWRV